MGKCGIMRYSPHNWSNILTNKVSPQYSLLISKYLRLFEIKYPMLVSELITNYVPVIAEKQFIEVILCGQEINIVVQVEGYILAQAEGYILAQVEVQALVQVEDYILVRAEVYIPVQVEDYILVQAGDYTLARVGDCTQDTI